MSSDAASENETRGIALAGLLIAFAHISYVDKKGIIPKPDAVDLFQGALEIVEIYPANDPGIPVARQLVDFLARIVATGGTLGPTANRTE
jgi:hypothetical protein